MPDMRTEIEQRGPVAPVADNLREVTDRISTLVRDHFELARAELQTSVKKAGRDIAFTTVGAVLLAVGYALLMFAAAYGLAALMGEPLGFLIVAAVHLVIGAVLVAVFAKRLTNKDKPGMPATTDELSNDKRFLSRVNTILREERPEERQLH